jgi:hypothetical protein
MLVLTIGFLFFFSSLIASFKLRRRSLLFMPGKSVAIPKVRARSFNDL